MNCNHEINNNKNENMENILNENESVINPE